MKDKTKEQVEHAEVQKESQEFVEDTHKPTSHELRKLTAEQERALYRKIDFRLMPILTLLYLLSFMDKGAFFAGHIS